MARRSTIIVLVLLAATCTACSTTSGSSTATTASPSSTAPTTKPTGTSGRPVVTPAGAWCDGTHLAVSIQTSFVGMGNAAEELGFTNTGTTACILSGYPKVAALDSQGHQVTLAKTHQGPPAEVTLQPGQIAQAVVEGGNGSIRPCSTFTRSFEVTPPHTTQSVRVTAKSTSAAMWAFDTCWIWIAPVTPESTQPVQAP